MDTQAEFFRDVFNALQMPLFILNGTTIGQTNSFTASMFGKTVDEMVGDTLENYLPSGRTEVTGETLSPEEYIKAARNNGEPTLFKTELKRGKDYALDLVITVSPVQGEGRENISVLFLQESQEAELAERTMLRRVIENIPEMVFWKDKDLKYLGSNEAFAKTIGMDSAEALIGKSDESIMRSQNAARYHESDRKVLETKAPLKEEFTSMRTDGEARLRTVKLPLVDASGEVLGVLGMVEDITEQFRLETQIKKLLDKRGEQVRISVDIAQQISGATALDQLFELVVTLIKERFDYYHAQIFRFDPQQDVMELVVGYGERGRSMLSAGHQLPVGRGVVGTAASTGAPVLASNVMDDPDWVRNQYLPDTKGELAVPIKFRNEVIGILDVQSDKAHTLSADDQLLLESLCGQIAVAIEDTRLRQETAENLKELQSLQRVMSRDGWRDYETRREDFERGYLYDQNDIQPTSYDSLLPFVGSGAGSNGHTSVTTSMSVRGEPIGVLGIEDDPNNPLSPEEETLLQAVSIQVAEALEKARLLENTQRQTADLATLNEMGQALTGLQTVDAVFENVYKHTTRLMDTTIFILAIFDSENNLVSYPYVSDAGNWVDIPARPLENGPTDYVIRKNKALLLSENTEKQMEALGIKARQLGEPSKSWLGVPMALGEEVLGVIVVQSTTNEGLYLPRHRDLLVAVAQQTAIAIQNARLFQQTQRQNQNLAALNELGRELTSLLDVESVIETIFKYTSRLLGDHTFLASLYDPQNNEVTFPLAVEDGKRVEVPARRNENGITEYVIKSRKPLLIKNNLADKAKELGVVYFETGRPTLSWLAVPMSFGQETIGLLSIQSYKASNLFTERDQELLLAIASQAATAIQNARLFQETENALAETETLYRAGAELNATDAFDNILAILKEYTVLGHPAAEHVTLNLFDTAWNESNRPNWIIPIAAWSKVQPKEAPPSRLPLANWDTIQKYVSSTEPQIIPNVAAVPEMQDTALLVYGKTLNVKSAVLIPVNISGVWNGHIIAYYSETIGLSDQESRRLTALVGQASVTLQNIRLLDDSRRRATQLQIASEIARDTSGTLALDVLLRRLVDLIIERFDYYHASVFLLDEDGRNAILQESTGEAGAALKKRGHSLAVGSQSIVGASTQTGEPLVVNDVSKDPIHHFNPLLPETKAEIGIPLKLGTRVIGALDVQSTDIEAFSAGEVAVLQILADQIAVAIDNARTYQLAQSAFEETQQRVGELTNLFDVSQTLGATQPNMVEIAEVINPKFTSLSGKNSYSSFAIYDPDTDMMQVIYDDDTTHGDFRSAQRPDAYDFKLSDFPATKQVMETLQPAVIHLSNKKADPAELAYMEAEGVKTLLILALPIKGQSIGVVEIETQEKERHYSTAELSLLTTMANQTAVALENARLYEETRVRLAEQQWLYQVTTGAASSLTLDDALQSATRTLRSALRGALIAILLVDEGSQDLQVRASAGYEEDLSGFRIKVGEGITGWVAQTGETILAPDARQHERFKAALGDARSELTVPLKLGKRVIGVINAESYSVNELNENDQRLLTTVSGTLAAVISNTQLFEGEQRQRRVAATLAAAAEKMSETLSETDLRHLLIEEIYNYASPETVTLYEWNQEKEMFIIDLCRTGDDIPIEDLPLGKPAPEEISDSLWKSFKERQDIEEDFDAVGGERKSHYLLPWSIGESPTGVLEIIQENPESTFRDEDKLLFEGLVDQAANALRLAFLYTEQRDLAERLAEVDRLKSEFLANMSHELRTPLNSIIGFSRVILKGIDGPISDLQEQDLNAIYNAGQHLLGLINDVLDLSKIEAGKMELAFEDVSMTDLIASVMSTGTGLVKDKPVQLINKVDPDLPMIRADGTRLRQVLLNLISNATKFTEKGNITVQAYLTEEPISGRPEIVTKVVDTGIGIAMDDMHKLFEAFSQVDSSPTRQTGGTGLGLAISRQLIELHGGRIWVESEVGQGSTFAFSIPLPYTQITGSGERLILSVDDNSGALTLYRRYLEPAGYSLTGITDPLSAVESARRIRPYAIILDIFMPEKDGWEIITDLKSDPLTREIPIIVCTMSTDRERGINLGVSEYFSKPVLEEELLDALKNLEKDSNGRLEAEII